MKKPKNPNLTPQVRNRASNRSIPNPAGSKWKIQKVRIIAGPCSVDKDNIKDIYKIAEIKVNGRPAIWGTRVVGLKSRTKFNPKGEGMGIDFKTFMENLEVKLSGGCCCHLSTPESVEIAKKIVKDTGLLVATEVMEPLLQLEFFEDPVFEDKLMIWNPAVNQLGWPLLVMSAYARKNNWFVGIKNPKWVGEHLSKANTREFKGETTMEKTWKGLVSYANLPQKTILIHRGVDVPEKGDYRNAPVHYIAKRVKKATGCSLFFDPSHSHGPTMKEEIVPATVKAMKMKLEDGSYLYDGILVEAGRSKTDTEQHIALKELEEMVKRIAEFREIEGR